MNHSTAKWTLAAGLAGCGLIAFASSVGAQGIGVEELEEMLIPTPQKIERGEQIYQNQCAGCHGPNGEGKVEYPAEKFKNPSPDFTRANYRHGGGRIQVYNVITKGLQGEGLYHPKFTDALRYQERWAVTHYVRDLGPTAELTDPPEVVEQAKLEAEKGTCDPAVKSTISARVEPKGQEQLDLGKKLYGQNCATCHGDTGKGDGPAGKALQPPPRNFHAADAQWTNGTSPLNIFNTLTNGIDGTAMASYASMSEDERWAMTHYLRQWIPEQKRQESTPEDITAVCRSLSTPEPPEPITTQKAMRALIDDQPEERYLRLAKFGPIELSEGASADRGRNIYMDQCAKCHGQGMKGRQLGPYGVERAPQPDRENPVLTVKVRGLVKGHAGGTFRDFAARSTGGVHATLPNMTPASLLDKQDWQDLQAYVASVEGQGKLGKLRPGKIRAPGVGSSDSAGGNNQDGGVQPSGASNADATSTTGSPDAGTASPDAGQ